MKNFRSSSFQIFLFLGLVLFGSSVNSQSIAIWNNVSDGFRTQGTVRMGKAAESPSNINSYQSENPLSKLYQERIGAGVEKIMGQLKTRIVLISSDRQIVYQNFPELCVKFQP